MKRFSQFEARDHAAVIRALRSKTVARGASTEEARSAANKADELEKKHVKSKVVYDKQGRRAVPRDHPSMSGMGQRLHAALKRHEAMMAKKAKNKMDKKA